MKKLLKALLLPCALILLMGADNQEARFQNLGGKIMCTCSCSQMLLKCNHVGCPNSARMIGQLHDQLGDGRPGAPAAATSKSDEDVLNFFRTEWGVTAVVEPSQHGFELLAWILPFVGLIAGTILLMIVVTKWKRRPASVNAADSVRDPHLDALRQRARQETEI